MQHTGNHMKISETGARVIGNYNNVTGSGCTVTGNYNKVSGSGSTVCGNYNNVSSTGATVNGNYNNVSGTGSIVKGNYNNVSGLGSSVQGKDNIVTRDESTNKNRDRAGNSLRDSQPPVVRMSMDKNSVMCINGFPGFENVNIHCGQFNTGGARFLGNVTFSDTPESINFGTINQRCEQAGPEMAARPRRGCSNRSEQRPGDQTDVEEIKNNQYPDTPLPDGANACSICMDRISDVIAMPCGHKKFCGLCVMGFHRSHSSINNTSNKTLCPICKKDVVKFGRVFE